MKVRTDSLEETDGPNEKPFPRHGKRRQELPPNLPQHNLPQPYARLLLLGDSEDDTVYGEIASQVKAENAGVAAEKLRDMALDETYYDYAQFYDDEDDYFANEPRMWTRLHAVRTLMRLDEAAQIAIEPLLPLLDEEDDPLREEMPFFYAEMGAPAIEPLARTLNDHDASPMLRANVAESLSELGQQHPELRTKIVPVLEQALIAENEDEMLAGFIVMALLDLKAKESLPLIQQAFEEERVDETLVQMADVEEHFDLPRVTPRKRWEDFLAPEDEEGDYEDEEEDGPPQQPYVAPAKVGRNELCPCGSGKKYKKCCGA